MNKVYWISALAFLMSACGGSGGTKVAPAQQEPSTGQVKPLVAQPVASSGNLFGDLADALEEEEASSEGDYELYFHDSRGIRYSLQQQGQDRLQTSVESLIDDVLNGATHRIQAFRTKRKVNLSLEISGDDQYRDDVVTIAERHLLNKRRYVLQSQDEDMKNLVGKILRRELDPFYQSSNDVDIAAEVSDYVLYIRFKSGEDELSFKGGMLSKSGEVLSVSSQTLSLKEDADVTKKWLDIRVPYADGQGAKTFQVNQSAINSFEYNQRGSKLNSATNINFEQANAYCLDQEGELVHPYAFEYARRSRKILPPGGNAKEEMVAPFDIEEHEIFYHPEDKLELDEEESYSSIIVFNWVTETYYAASNTYRSHNMTFRCMRN